MPLTKEQEKAKELIDKFENVDDCDKHYDDRHSPCSHQAKQCAIICIEQIIEQLATTVDITGSSFVVGKIKYWQETLEHIKNS